MVLEVNLVLDWVVSQKLRKVLKLDYEKELEQVLVQVSGQA